MPTLTDNSFQPLASLEAITHLRVTQVAKLIQCPREWKAVLLGEGETGDNRWGAIGTAVHGFIERFLGGHFDLFDTGWHQEILELEAAGVSARERGNAVAYAVRLAGWRRHVFALETEVEGQLVAGAPLIRGHVDCLFRPYPGLLVIRDHKTNRHYQDAAWWRSQWQPRLYSWLVRQRWPDLALQLVFEIGYVNLGEVVRWTPDPLDWFELEPAYAAAWAEIEDSRRTGRWREQRGDHCAFCPVRLDCATSRAATRALLGAMAGRLRKELK